MFGRAAKPKAGVTRSQALAGLPFRRPVLSLREEGEGDLRVTLLIRTAAWLRFIGGQPQIERSFVLDPLGREVYEACDGRTSVRKLADAFARAHRVSPAEAEAALSTFLRILMNKGLVDMALPRGRA